MFSTHLPHLYLLWLDFHHLTPLPCRQKCQIWLHRVYSSWRQTIVASPHFEFWICLPHSYHSILELFCIYKRWLQYKEPKKASSRGRLLQQHFHPIILVWLSFFLILSLSFICFAPFDDPAMPVSHPVSRGSAKGTVIFWSRLLWHPTRLTMWSALWLTHRTCCSALPSLGIKFPGFISRTHNCTVCVHYTLHYKSYKKQDSCCRG